MAIRSRSERPDEWASKANHTHIIKDEFVQEFLERCDFPKDIEDIANTEKDYILELEANINNPIENILAVDGGYTTTDVKKGFPSSQIAFFQFGAVLFTVEDLNNLSEKPFIFPEDMQKLHNLQRFKLALPVRNLIINNEKSLTHSIRKTIYEFFMKSTDDNRSTFMETLKWLAFEEYHPNPRETYVLANNPYNQNTSEAITLYRKKMSNDYTFDINGNTIYLTDIFRLHESIDDEHGAAGILGYTTRVIEQVIIMHFIRFIYNTKPALLEKYLFISDGPLSFSGVTANMNKLARKFCNFLQQKQKVYFVGIEKSGAFVEHAREICNQKEEIQILGENRFMLLSNKYIYKYITPGDYQEKVYGSTSYYSGKAIFHSPDGQILVLSVPTEDKQDIVNPTLEKYRNLEVILINVQKLRCAMYDDSIVPIALANKLVSLANHPSKVLLGKFAQQKIN